MRKTVYYAFGALTFIPWVLLLAVGLLFVGLMHVLGLGLGALHKWSHAELHRDTPPEPERELDSP